MLQVTTSKPSVIPPIKLFLEKVVPVNVSYKKGELNIILVFSNTFMRG